MLELPFAYEAGRYKNEGSGPWLSRACDVVKQISHPLLVDRCGAEPDPGFLGQIVRSGSLGNQGDSERFDRPSRLLLLVHCLCVVHQILLNIPSLCSQQPRRDAKHLFPVLCVEL